MGVYRTAWERRKAAEAIEGSGSISFTPGQQSTTKRSKRLAAAETENRTGSVRGNEKNGLIRP